MLKIKDGIQLKELEKYGFRNISKSIYEYKANVVGEGDDFDVHILVNYRDSLQDNNLYIYISNEYLETTYDEVYELPTVLFYMIKDGIVEVVNEDI